MRQNSLVPFWWKGVAEKAMKERGVVCEDDAAGRGENCTIGVVYTYHEKKDTAASGHKTQNIRLRQDAVKDFDCCCLSLQPCHHPRWLLIWARGHARVHFATEEGDRPADEGLREVAGIQREEQKELQQPCAGVTRCMASWRRRLPSWTGPSTLSRPGLPRGAAQMMPDQGLVWPLK